MISRCRSCRRGRLRDDSGASDTLSQHVHDINTYDYWRILRDMVTALWYFSFGIYRRRQASFARLSHAMMISHFRIVNARHYCCFASRRSIRARRITRLTKTGLYSLPLPSAATFSLVAKKYATHLTYGAHDSHALNALYLKISSFLWWAWDAS